MRLPPFVGAGGVGEADHRIPEHLDLGAVLRPDAFLEEVTREIGADFIDRFEERLKEELLSPLGRNPFADPTSVADLDAWLEDDIDGVPPGGRKERSPNRYAYKFGDVEQANWYRKYLAPDVRGMQERLSREDRFGTFRASFRFPLCKVEQLANRFLSEGWIRSTQRCRDERVLKIKAELLIMSCLNMLGQGVPFRTQSDNTNISVSEHRKFFHKFINKLYEIRDEFIYLPRDEAELRKVMGRYEDAGLPGAGGSKDVVHVKWSKCPAGDDNRAKGKDSYPTLAFECISDFDRRIMGVSHAQFGTRNDKHIVKIDHNVAKIRRGWYKDVKWQYYTADGTKKTDTGVYLICDNGYLRWPISMCPFKHAKVSTPEGYWSSNLESVQKDVECVFGILKKRWAILDRGIRFRNMLVGEKIFVSCCVLHNMMLDMMQRGPSDPRVGVGSALPGDGVFLEGPTEALPEDASERALSTKWGKRRYALVEHFTYSKRQRRL